MLDFLLRDESDDSFTESSDSNSPIEGDVPQILNFAPPIEASRVANLNLLSEPFVPQPLAYLPIEASRVSTAINLQEEVFVPQPLA